MQGMSASFNLAIQDWDVSVLDVNYLDRSASIILTGGSGE